MLISNTSLRPVRQMLNPIYSICVPNLNMGKTLEEALISVLSQIDLRFEIIVIDDGSTDNSIEKLEKLKIGYPNLRTKYLFRDPTRTLAETRNISVQEARGDYCLLHIDCDDIWEPYILDFITIFHDIEKFLGEDVLLCGQQINMGKKSFLLEHGPYKFGHMVEDRDMWYRLASINKFVPLDHVVFRHRMPLTRKQKWKKKFLLTAKILSDEIRVGNRFNFYFTNIWRDYMKQSLELRMYKVLVYPICLLRAKRLGPIVNPGQFAGWKELKQVAKEKNGTVFEIFEKRGSIYDSSKLSPAGKWVFSHKATDKLIREIPDNLHSFKSELT